MCHKELEWKELGEEELYKARVFSLYKSRLRNMRGYEADFFYLRSPDWVTVLAPVMHKGRESLLAVLQRRHGSGELSLEFPGGIIEEGESVTTAARRELLEECSCHAGTLTVIGSSYSNPAILNNRFYTVLAENLTCANESEHRELKASGEAAGEILSCQYIALDRVRQGMYPEYFTHSLMFTALSMYWGWKKKGADRIRTGE